MQLQLEDGVGLAGGERLFRIELGRAAGGVNVDFLAAEVEHQIFAGVGAVGAAANDGDDVVEMIEGGQVAFENVLAVFRLLQQVGGAAADHVDAVLDEILDGLNQAQLAGLSVDDRQQNHRKTLLHLGVLEELVQNDLWFCSALQLDDDAHAVAVGFVANVGDVFDLFVVHQRRDALDQIRLVHLVRNFGDDDGLAIFAEGFDGGFGAHQEAAAAGAVGFENSRAAVNHAGSRKIGALHELQNLGELGAGIVHQSDGRVDDLGEIVRRNFCGHADGNSVRAIDQKIGNARGQHVGLDFAAVVIVVEVDGFFVEVFEQRGRNLREFGFSVTIGRGRVAVDGAEVALPENQRIAHRPILREPDESIVNSEVAGRRVFAHDFATDAGALAR